MIKIKHTDSIIDIIRKIEGRNSDEIILDFPVGNSILHNYVSLSILKKKVKNKTLIIITNDIHAKKIGKNLGIKYTIVKNKKILKDTNILAYNYTFLEYLLFLIKNYIKILFFQKKQHTYIYTQYNKILHHKYIKNDPTKIGFFIAGLLLSFFLFLFVFYFAVNKTYITVVPEILIKTRAKNIIFKEISENKNNTFLDSNEVKLHKISKYVSLSQTFGTSGFYNSQEGRSKGMVEIFNTLNEPITLRENTRLQSETGIIFVLKKRITIPAGNIDEKGKIIATKKQVHVIAKLSNIHGEFTGKKGNLKKGIFLFFPGLDTNIQKKVYSRTIENFQGGSSDYVKIIAKNDIKSAKNIMEEKLKNKGLAEIKKQILNGNKSNNVTYKILGINNIIQYTDLKIQGAEHLKIGDKKEKFTLIGSMQVNTYIYNKDLVINKLKTTIKDNLLTNIENINFINDDSLRFSNIISKKNNPFQIKVTAEIEVFYSHNFLGRNNNYIEKLRNTIVGLNKKQARDILINNSKISNVSIETRPFFIKKISKIPNNIIFKVEEQ